MCVELLKTQVEVESADEPAYDHFDLTSSVTISSSSFKIHHFTISMENFSQEETNTEVEEDPSRVNLNFSEVLYLLSKQAVLGRVCDGIFGNDKVDR